VTYAPELLAAPRTSRYNIISLLGRGASSLVYKAFDVEKNFLIALKSLRFPEHDDIYHIKQEFRFFRDFCHYNLVSLYDLFIEDESCFYTMEFIDGLDFVSFMRSHDGALRHCLGQLVGGLAALHEAGRLHRDLKPSNILVEPSRRTVLLDFGLSTEVHSQGSIISQTRLYAGTPAYMAPEQLAGGPASPASDFYSLGVVLYQALTGTRPYPELPPVALYEAQKTPPAAPRGQDSDVPEGLAAAALALLSFEPRDRPPLAELTRLAQGSSGSLHGTAVSPLADRFSRPFVGREAELAQLERAFARTLAGERAAMHVSGISGVGKTALIERFLATARSRTGSLVLRSRCHHQESVRFNAVDGVFDMLSRYLMQESAEQLSQLAPQDLPALVTMFPVLGRVPFPFDRFDRDAVASDPQTIVRQALVAFRELLDGIAARRPLILWMDDLQWSDTSSLPLLREIATAGAGKPIMSIFSYRTEDLQLNSVPAALARGMAADPDLETEHIVLEPLASSAVEALVQSLVEDRTAVDPAWVSEVAQQSAGLPFFVIELTAYWSKWLGSGETRIGGMSAGGILDQRLRSLPTLQRAVLEIVSVASTPLLEEALVRITASESASGREIYQLLQQNLLRKGEANGRPTVEIYHDRIRVSVLASLDAATRRLRHREIADEMARAAELDHPLLVEHFLGAGDPARAADHAILAGRRAAERLAFDQAAEFLLLAARLRDPNGEDSALAVELADALAHAGRSSEAGDLFLRAARLETSDPLATAEYEARAAQQFLYSGRLAAGREVYCKLFTDLGLAFPETVRAANRISITNRIPFAVGLRRLKVRSAGESPAQALMRVDTLWAASKGFLMLDYVVGDAIFSCYMREAAALGERSRVLRALALEAAVMANIGRHWSIRRSNALLRHAEDLAEKSTDPYDHVVLQTCQATIAWFCGRWREAAELAQGAVTLHRRDCVRYDFEVPVALGYRISAMVMQGTIKQAKAEALDAIEDAQRRGDIYISRLFKSGYCTYIALAENDPDTAIADAEALLNDVPPDRFTSLHWSHFIAKVNALVYAERAWDAWWLVQRQWPLIRRTGFLRLACIGAHLHEIRARACLKAATDGQPPEGLEEWTPARLLRLAEEDARIIAHTGTVSHAAATAAAVRSGIAGLQGDPDRRREQLEIAWQGFGQAGMTLHRAAAGLQLASLRPRTEREGLDAAGQEIMVAEGISHPDRMSAFLMFT
jgi:eukaryotic-like serine/threonine-protein kinase